MIEQYTITNKYNFPQPSMDTSLPQRFLELSIHSLRQVRNQSFQLNQQTIQQDNQYENYLTSLQLKRHPLPLTPRTQETLIAAVDTSTIKIGDIEFEIESQEDQIQTAVDRILTAVTERMKDTRLTERQAPPPRAETCKSLIQKLWEENWFSEPRGLDDVHTELARKGFHYDRTAVAHALVDLVKDNILTRIGKPRRYQYAQKRPPT